MWTVLHWVFNVLIWDFHVFDLGRLGGKVVAGLDEALSCQCLYFLSPSLDGIMLVGVSVETTRPRQGMCTSSPPNTTLRNSQTIFAHCALTPHVSHTPSQIHQLLVQLGI